MLTHARLALVALAAALTLGGCDHHNMVHAHPWAGVNELVAVVKPTGANTAHGVVRFTKVSAIKDGDISGVRIVADFEGLQPNSIHAFHIHEFGDATKADATSAGSHYNPAHNPHGKPGDEKRHAGDLGNLQADANGRAHYDRLDDQISLVALHNPILGRAVIVHAGEDKFTQPVGDAGSRIAIGVIGVAFVAPPAPAPAPAAAPAPVK